MRSIASVLFLFVAACGDDGPTGDLADAPRPDDAPVTPDSNIDAPTAPVKMTVVDNEGPVEGLKVVFQNADGSLVSTQTTNASGEASAVMEAGGSVTVIDAFPTRTFAFALDDVRTFVGVKPGDELRLDRRFPSNGVTVTMSVPDLANATRYTVHSTCSEFPFDITTGGSAAAATQISLENCGTGDFLVEALDNDFQSIGYLFVPNVTVADGMNIDLTGNYVPGANRNFKYTNIADPHNSFVTFTNSIATARGVVRHRGNELGFEGNEATTDIPVPPVTTGQVSITASQFGSVGSSFTRVIGWGAHTTDDYVFDGATAFLPEFSSEPIFDAPSGSITWTQTGGSATPDFAAATVFFVREGQTSKTWMWRIVVPYGTASAIAFPTLPTEFAELNPLATDSVFPSTVITGKITGGYDAVREQALNALAPAGFTTGFETVAVGASGQAILVESQINQQGKSRQRAH